MTAPEGGAAPFRLALNLARRELRGGLRGFRTFLASLALGIGAIAAVGTLTESLLEGLRGDGRVLLGGDLDLRLAHREITPEQRTWLAARGRLSQVTHLRAMAHATNRGNNRRALIERGRTHLCLQNHFPTDSPAGAVGGTDGEHCWH